MADITFASGGANRKTRSIPLSGIFLLETASDQLDNEDGTGDSIELEGTLDLIKFDYTMPPALQSVNFRPAQLSSINVPIPNKFILIQEDGFDIDNEDGTGDSILQEDSTLYPTVELVLTNKTRALESPITLIEGTKRTYSCTFQNADTITSPSVAVFKDGQTTEYTSTAMPSGSATASGNVITLPELVIVDGDGGSFYSVVVTGVHSGDTDTRKFRIDIEKKEAG